MDDQQQAFQDFEHHAWDEVATRYAEVASGLTRQIADPLLDAGGVQDGSRVLDVACGPGFTVGAALQRGAEVSGADLSESMLAIAAAGNPTASFDCAAAEDLPHGDGVFDTVLSAFGLPHFADHAAVFAEFRRVLTPGGRLAMSTWAPPGENPFFGIALGSMMQAGDMVAAAEGLPPGEDIFLHSDEARCAADLSAAGFADVELTQAVLNWEVDDAASEFISFLEGGGARSRAMYAAQSDENKAAVKDTIASMVENYRQGDGYVIPAVAVVVSGRAI